MTEGNVVLEPRVSLESLATLGEGHIAYVKQIRSEDVPGLFPQAPHLAPGLKLFALHTASGQPIMLTEFGGISLSAESNSWGYSRSDTPAQLLDRYGDLLEAVCSLPSLAGFCYTQFTDTYQETNGLLYADRTPKAPFDQIAACTNGRRPPHDARIETSWRESA